MNVPAGSRSAIIAVGDELLGGHTLDTNSHWLSSRLRSAGLVPVRVVQVPDRLERIAGELRHCLDDPEVGLILLCGGLGPTPDDRTLEALALALDRPLTTHPQVLAMVQDFSRRMHERGRLASPEPPAGMLKLAQLPDSPDQLLLNPAGSCPGLLYRLTGAAGPVRLFVLPGVPAELRAIFEQVLAPAHLPPDPDLVTLEAQFTGVVEAAFYDVLRRVESEYPEVSVGSYPQRETRAVVIRASGRSQAQVIAALAMVEESVRGGN